MSESRKRGLLRLRHLAEVTEAKGEEMAEAASRFDRLASADARPRVVSAPLLFQTPPELARRLTGMFDRFGRTLEPSAGLGRLYRAIREVDRDCPVVLVEVAPQCSAELYRATEGDEAARLVCGDFLTMGEDRLGRFDSVIMNPPFRRGLDISHVRHAMTLLEHSGMLAAIVANGPRQRAQLLPIASQWIDLPAGSFRTEGTGVDTAIFCYRAA